MNLAERFEQKRKETYGPDPAVPHSTFALWVGEPGLARLWSSAQLLAADAGSELGSDLIEPGEKARYWARLAGCLQEASGRDADKIAALAARGRALFGWSDAELSKWAISALSMRCEPKLDRRRMMKPESDAIFSWLAKRARLSQAGMRRGELLARLVGESAAVGRSGLVDFLAASGLPWTPSMLSELVCFGASACSEPGKKPLADAAARAAALAGATPSAEDVFRAWLCKCEPLAEVLLDAGADVSEIENLPEALGKAWELKQAQRLFGKGGRDPAEMALLARARAIWESHTLASQSPAQPKGAEAGARRL